MLQLNWMSPHKLPSHLQKVEVDFVEILARVENSDSQPGERDGDLVESITVATRSSTFQPLRIGWSSAANLFFAIIAVLGALISTVYFLNNSEHSRRLHTGWPGEFLYPRPGTETKTSEMIAQTVSRVGSTSARHARQDSDAGAIFRDLASANPVPGVSPGSLASSNSLSPQTANQTADNSSNSGGSVADQSPTVGQSGMSQTHSASSQRASFGRSHQRSSAAMSRKASITRQSLFDWPFASSGRSGHDTTLSSMRSMRSSPSAMQARSGVNVNHVQTRMLMTGGSIAHALHAGDLGGNVQVRHHGAHR